MSTKVRLAMIAVLTAVLGLVFSGPAFALFPDPPGGDPQAPAGAGLPTMRELGNLQHGPCVRDLLDLPALKSCEDAEGRVIMDLPAINLVGPKAQPKKLPVTGANAGDFAAMGMAALAAGFVLLRRVRPALAS